MKWDDSSLYLSNSSNKIEEIGLPETFITFLPENNIALLSAEDENENWVQVVYNQSKGLKGWVKKRNQQDFMTWYQFVQKYGKEKGLCLFTDIPDKYKKAYTAPDEGAQYDKNVFYITDNIDLIVIKGNWMLVKIIDFNKSEHVGWIRWRDDSGSLLVFPNLSADSF